MTLIKDLIDIPDRVYKDQYVLRLSEGVTRPAETLRNRPRIISRSSRNPGPSCGKVS